MPALGRQRKQDNEFETSLSYIVKLCLKTTKMEGAAAKEEKNLAKCSLVIVCDRCAFVCTGAHLWCVCAYKNGGQRTASATTPQGQSQCMSEAVLLACSSPVSLKGSPISVSPCSGIASTCHHTSPPFKMWVLGRLSHLPSLCCSQTLGDESMKAFTISSF